MELLPGQGCFTPPRDVAASLVCAVRTRLNVIVIYDKADQLKIAENDLGTIVSLLDKFEKKSL
jgi:hypothetical protein